MVDICAVMVYNIGTVKKARKQKWKQGRTKQRKITLRQETIISKTEQMKIGLHSAMQKFFVADLVF